MKYVIRMVALIFVLLASVLGFLLTTTPGLHTSILLANLLIPGKIQLRHAEGSLLKHIAFSEFSYSNQKLHIQLNEGILHWRLFSLLHSQLAANLSAQQLNVHIKDPSPFDITKLKFPFKLYVRQLHIQKVHIQRLNVQQSFEQLELRGALLPQQWIIHALHAQIAQLRCSVMGEGDLQIPYALHASLQIKPIAPSTHPTKANIEINGNLARYTWHGKIQGPGRANLTGSLEAGTVLTTKTEWQDFSWPIKSTSRHFKSSQGQVSIKGTLPKIALQANARVEEPFKSNWQLSAQTNDDHVDFNGLLQLDAPLKTQITAKGSLYNPQQAHVRLNIHPGAYHLPLESPLPEVAFQQGEILIDLNPKGLNSKGTLILDAYKTINMALHMPHFSLDTWSSHPPMLDGQLTLQMKTLDFLEHLHLPLEHPHGQLNMRLSAKGPLFKPLVKGELYLTNAGFSLTKAGLTFSPIHANLTSSNDHWQATGTINTEGHTLTLKGQGTFFPELTGQLNLQGTQFPVVNTEHYKLYLSPQLSLVINPKTLKLTGSILVPSATIKPVSFSNTTNLSQDVVFVSHQPKSSMINPFNLTTDIDIRMGQDVRLDIKGLQGFLDGTLHVKQAPHSVMQARGELNIRHGQYHAFGQDLTIDPGQLHFTGGPIDNPELYIRAIRKLNTTDMDTAASQTLDFSAANIDTTDLSAQTTVGIELEGRLNAHQIKLFSIPANLSQADILSLLLLGKPASQASSAGGQLLLAAISSMNLDSGAKGLQLLSQLKQSLGIDFNLKNNNPGYNQAANLSGEKTTLIVGKSLTKRLYLSYNMSLLQNDSNVLTLKYLLNKYFSIQVTASDTGNGLDLLYTRSQD